MLDRMSNASRLVEKLKQKGLVDRSECIIDRRQVDVLITRKGLDLLEEIGSKLDDNIIETITEEEAIALNRILDKFRG
jgi:DNA-binding MarR family transcriptional regulator